MKNTEMETDALVTSNMYVDATTSLADVMFHIEKPQVHIHNS